MAKKSRRTKTSPGTTAPKAGVGAKGSWKLLDRGATIASGLLANRVAMVAWRGVTGRKPPTNGQHPEVSTGEAVAWAVVGGALVEVVQMTVRRSAIGYWMRSTGNLPPGMKPLTGAPNTIAPDAKKPVPVREPAPVRRKRRRR